MNQSIQIINHLLEMIRYYTKQKRQETNIEIQKQIDTLIVLMSNELSKEFEMLKSTKGYNVVRYQTDNYKDTNLLDEIMCLVEMIRHYEFVGDPLSIDYRTELEQFLFKVVK